MFKKLARTTHYYVIGVTPSKWVKKGAFARSRAPPTRIIFKMCESQQDRLVLRFHNRAPLHGAISNLEEVIAEKPKKSRFFSTIFSPKLAKSLRRFVNFDQILKVAAKW